MFVFIFKHDYNANGEFPVVSVQMMITALIKKWCNTNWINMTNNGHDESVVSLGCMPFCADVETRNGSFVLQTKSIVNYCNHYFQIR